jgi:hypothetical protein
MKKNVRNALAISGLAIALGTSGIIFDASANSRSPIQYSHQQRIIRSRKTENAMRFSFKRNNINATVTTIASDSLIVFSGETTYTVKISSSTRLLNKGWGKINISDIKVGDKIKVSGNVAGAIITARKIRDISL